MSRNESDVKLKSERELRFYRWFYQYESALLSYHLKPAINTLNISYLYSLDIKKASVIINAAVRSFYHPEIANGFIRNIRMNVNERFIPSRDFAWIKNCPDACYYAWLVIRTIKIKTPSLFSAFSDTHFYSSPLTPQILTYDHLDLIQYPANHAERMLTITDFFDRCDASLKEKIELMHAIRTEWYRLYIYKDRFPLNKKEKEKCEWAWRYIQKYRYNIRAGAKKRKQKKEEERKQQVSGSQNTLQDNSNALHDEYMHPQPLVTTLSQAHQYMSSQCQVTTLSRLHQDSPPVTRHNEFIADSAFDKGTENSAYINTATLMQYLKPSCCAEKRLIIRCLYTCWFHTDDKFINRFQKAWEGINARKKSRERKRLKASESKASEKHGIAGSEATSIVMEAGVELPREKTLPEALREVSEQKQHPSSAEDTDDNNSGNKPFMELPY